VDSPVEDGGRRVHAGGYSRGSGARRTSTTTPEFYGDDARAQALEHADVCGLVVDAPPGLSPAGSAAGARGARSGLLALPALQQWGSL
jgi:hypothetical protein